MAFEPAALLIGLREGMEIFLVLGVLLGILTRLGHQGHGWVVWTGFGAGVVTAAAAGGLILATLRDWFENRGGAAVFEIVVALAAIGVLTWMVLWMQKHARTLTKHLQDTASKAAATGNWFAIGFLAYVTVLREGLEIVLFFGALAASASWGDIILSGVLGFAISAVLAFVLFRAIVKVDVRRFFAVSGFLLIVIAAGLIVHVMHAAMDLGWLPHGDPLWDTSGFLPDEDHWLGGPLHAFIGYEDQPTVIQLLGYLGYILGVGGWYATRLADPSRRDKVQKGAVAAVLALLALFALGGALGLGAGEEAHDDADAHSASDHAALTSAGKAALADYEGRIGILVRQHGEWIEYNASTYESVKQFVRDIWPYTGLPSEALEADDGTYFLDEAHPFSQEAETDPRLVDVWLGGWDMPAVPIQDPTGMVGVDRDLAGGKVYFAPGLGPGVGEGDIFELAGIGAYRDWIKMENHSPMYGSVTAAWDYLATHLAKHYGDKVVPAFAFHVDPKVDANQTLDAAARHLVANEVDIVLDLYMSSVHSDSMNTCMMAPHAEHALHEAGFHGPIVPVRPAGLHPLWAEAVADYAEALAADYPDDVPLAFHLSQHGGTPGSDNPCGVGEDKYHTQTREEFAFSFTAIKERFASRAGDVSIRHVYGFGADVAEDNVLSPTEALELDRQHGARQAIIIPYEFWGNAMDNLVNLRESLGLTPDTAPYYDSNYETHGTWRGLPYRVTSATFETEGKVAAVLAQIDAALVSGLADQA